MGRSKPTFICLVFLGCAIVAQVAAQDATISGLIRDVNTHGKIRGANIFVTGTNIGTSSDYAGRFLLRIPGATSQMRVAFRHIAYEVRSISLDSLRGVETIYLQPRIIQLQGVQIEEEGYRKLEIEKDIPQTVAVLEARNFEIQGYVDAGDLMRIDHSVQLDEELSGKKTVAIRGGNPDEVVVLYNGVKLNNAYDNIFDLSLIDLEDVERFEIIKGSNTTLYGPEAFSGVINIVPKLQQDYTIRFQQRLGTYRSGNFGLHFYKKFKRLHSSYSYKRGGIQRNFADLPDGQSRLENSSLHHTANLSYNLSENADGSPASSIGLMWLYTSLDYDNRRDNEALNNFNHLISLKFSGYLPKFKDFDLSLSWRQLEEDQFLSFSDGELTGSLDRGIKDRSFHLNAEKGYELGRANLLFGYQFLRAELEDELDARNNFSGPQTGPLSSGFERTHHGFVAIAKYREEANSDFLQTFNIDLSIRHDRIRDRQSNLVFANQPGSEVDAVGARNDWRETMIKFSVNLAGYRDDLSAKGFLNFGKNVKFPTLFQQVSTPTRTGGLEPEKNRSFEAGVIISREINDHPNLFGWQISGNYFLNNYDNKFVEIRNIFGGRGLFMNTLSARISGFESKSSLFLFRKKVTVDFGWSRYFISDKEVFPFKSDFKRTLTLSIDHAGYAFQIHGFKEGEQVGLLLTSNSETVQVLLPDYTNLDVHLSKTFEIGKFKVFANASARNLLDDGNFQLEGLSIRDRRFYFTFGAQY